MLQSEVWEPGTVLLRYDRHIPLAIPKAGKGVARRGVAWQGRARQGKAPAPMTDEQWARQSREDQGLPPTIEDEWVAGRVAALLEPARMLDV